MRATLNSKSFAAGQIARDLWGHTDIAKYQTGLKKARNAMINKRGILMNTPGTQTILPWKFPTKPTRSIAFKFSFNQQYELIFGDKYIHIIKNGAPIFASTYTIAIFAQTANPGLIINLGSSNGVTSSQIDSGMLVQLQPKSSPTFLKNAPLISGDMSLYAYNSWYILQNVTINSHNTTFNITNLDGSNIDSTNWGFYLGNLQISTVYEIATTYLYGDLSLIKARQSFDIVQIRHHKYPRQQLQRFGDTNWNLTVNNGWPSQGQQCNSLGAAGGSGGQACYYKVSTYDLVKKTESLPCQVATTSLGVIQAITDAIYYNTYPWYEPYGAISLYMASTAGYVVGNSIYLSSSLSSGDVNFNSGSTTYRITYVGSGYITIGVTNGMLPDGTHLAYAAGAYIYTATVSTDYQIASITAMANGTALITITATTPAWLSSGNGMEVTIVGTNVVGLDGLTFNATVQSANTLSLNGVILANYDAAQLALFSSSTSTIISPTAITSANTPSSSSPVTISGALNGLSLYTTNTVFLVYRSASPIGGYGFVGEVVPTSLSNGFSFVDPGIPPDPTLSPKSYLPLFIGAGNYPSACNFYQQRLVELATDSHPQGLYASVIGDYNDFTIRDPLQEDDAIVMDVWSDQMQQIFDSADSGFLVLITDMGPMVAAGDTSGQFTPSTNLIKRYAFAGGAQQPSPLHIFKNIVYLEANQGCMRDLEVLVTPFYTYIDKSEDVSLFSEDLLTASPITAWDYKLYPDSQICSVRADGIAILTTYFQEQQIQAFSWMDTNNGIDKFMDVSCVQEGIESFAYWSVNRKSGGWIERMASRYYKDSTIDAVFTHATVSYNGLVNDGTTAVLSGAVTANGVVTATLSTNEGASYQVGWQVNFKYIYNYDEFGNPMYYTARMKVTGTGTNTITGTLFEAINPAMIGPSITDIRVCTNVVGGLWHLNGQKVSVVADGFEVASPDAGLLTVINGTVTMPNGNAFGVINVGLPYNSDIQTLDIDEEKGETFMDKKIVVPNVSMKVLNTGDFWVGQNFTEYLPPGMKMEPTKIRDLEGYLTPTKLFTGIIPRVPFDNKYGYGGSFALRMSSPLPMTILKIAPLVQVQ
jgi:hypothetical protein